MIWYGLQELPSLFGEVLRAFRAIVCLREFLGTAANTAKYAMCLLFTTSFDISYCISIKLGNDVCVTIHIQNSVFMCHADLDTRSQFDGQLCLYLMLCIYYLLLYVININFTEGRPYIGTQISDLAVDSYNKYFIWCLD